MRAYASRIVAAPIERVWLTVRRFDRLCDWHDAVADGAIEAGEAADRVGCIRAFHLADGTPVRERLVALDDFDHSLSYVFETPAFPVENYRATLRVRPVTATGDSFVEWWADFDEPAGLPGPHADLIANAVFAAGLEGLDRYLAGAGA